MLTAEADAEPYRPASDGSLLPITITARLLYKGGPDISALAWTLLLRTTSGGVVQSRSVALPPLLHGTQVAVAFEHLFDPNRRCRAEAFLCLGTAAAAEFPTTGATAVPRAHCSPYIVRVASTDVSALELLRPTGARPRRRCLATVHVGLASPAFSPARAHRFLHSVFLEDKSPSAALSGTALRSGKWRLVVEAPLSSFLLPAELQALLCFGRQSVKLPTDPTKWMLGPYGVHLECTAAQKSGRGLCRAVDFAGEASADVAPALAAAALRRLIDHSASYAPLFQHKVTAATRVSTKALVAVYERLLAQVDALLSTSAELSAPAHVEALRQMAAMQVALAGHERGEAARARTRLTEYLAKRKFD